MSLTWASAVVLRRWSVLVAAFASMSGAGQEQASRATEVNTREEPATFESRVHLVLAPVIVRDAQGRAVGTLTKDDFQLFDKGKLQTIAKFAVEGAAVNAPAALGATVQPSQEAEAAGSPPLPTRFVAYLFDDLHLAFGDLVRTRDAAQRQLVSLESSGRAAIYTTSGQVMVDFTDDRDQLRSGLSRIRPSARTSPQPCPLIGYYMADLIVNKNDRQALEAATAEAMACLNLKDAAGMRMAEGMARQAARQALAEGNENTRMALHVASGVIRRMSALPGSRNLVLVSPGFILPDEYRFDETGLIDKATQARVVINSIDARGLYVVDELGDISQPAYSEVAMRIKASYERMSANAQGDVLAELAHGTGGQTMRNSNDMADAFQRTAGVPEYVYLLGFSPQNLKYDGSYHSLKVVLKSGKHLAVQARRGYYAPREAEETAETAKREIEEALFSREESLEIPVELLTQFYKSSDVDAKLAVVARIDVKSLPFRKVDGRNGDELTVVAGLFDRNGSLVSGIRKVVTMRLRDETLRTRIGSGLTVKSSFDVKPGGYAIRLVVRDAEGRLISARNSVVEIP